VLREDFPDVKQKKKSTFAQCNVCAGLDMKTSNSKEPAGACRSRSGRNPNVSAIVRDRGHMRGWAALFLFLRKRAFSPRKSRVQGD
jgi:hypothetical protein